MKALATLLLAALPWTAAASTAPERLTADTPRTTVDGNTFVAPAEWTLTVKPPATILEAPEGDSRIVIVGVEAENADHAVERAWSAYPGAQRWPLKIALPTNDRDGWTQLRNYQYLTSPNEKLDVTAHARQANGRWSVLLRVMTQAVAEKRAAQVSVVFGEWLPRGVSRESFAGKRAHPLDAVRIAALGRFVEKAQAQLGVPGVSFGLVQDGKVVFAGGYGVRQLGSEAKADADTMYMIASNTKALTTLMLAKLVDEKKLTWETPATSLLPSFRLGDPETTRQVLVKHLICACTGLPRQDLEWLLEYGQLTPKDALATLGTMQPTSKFGELFQYSNPMAGAAGFLGGHVAYPELELGRAYDEAMRTRVFEPLGMSSTTFDYAKAQQGNFAAPHAPDVDGKTAHALMEVNYSILPVRPAGAAWSNVHDMLRYVQMELAEGKLPDGSRYIESGTLLARRAPQVATSSDTSYGMGLSVTTKYGVKVVYHGGDMIGYHSDMMWLPEHGVGAVILTNGDPGWTIRTQFRRKLLEVLFDGKPEADAAVEAAAKTWYADLAADRKLTTIPADAAESAKLAPVYISAALGEVAVTRAGASTFFDFGEWESEVGSRKNPDGTVSFVTTVPGMGGVDLVVGGNEKDGRTLILRDSQHEYVFTERR
jgi:CubicO group peptidase (beta-lactamase class C family)